MEFVNRPTGSGDAVPVDAQHVDPRMFEDAVAGHVVVLTAIATRLVEADAAADVVQESLLRAWRR